MAASIDSGDGLVSVHVHGEGSGFILIGVWHDPHASNNTEIHAVNRLVGETTPFETAVMGCRAQEEEPK